MIDLTEAREIAERCRDLGGLPADESTRGKIGILLASLSQAATLIEALIKEVEGLRSKLVIAEGAAEIALSRVENAHARGIAEGMERAAVIASEFGWGAENSIRYDQYDEASFDTADEIAAAIRQQKEQANERN